MTRRILAALVGLTAVLLAAVVVPLGAVRRAPRFAGLRRTHRSGRARSRQPGRGTAGGREVRAAPTAPIAVRDPNDRFSVFDIHGAPLAGITNAVLHLGARPQRSPARAAQRALDRRPRPLRRRASGHQFRAGGGDRRARAPGRAAAVRADPALAGTCGGGRGCARGGGAARARSRALGRTTAAPAGNGGGAAG